MLDICEYSLCISFKLFIDILIKQHVTAGANPMAR